MDHLHQVHGSTISGVRVPFVCNDRFKFDGGDFYTYAFRCGMVKDPETSSLQALNLRGQSIDELAPFLQACLFFGTLHTLFKGLVKTDYDWTDFVEKSEGGEVLVTTEKLPMFVWAKSSAEVLYVGCFG